MIQRITTTVLLLLWSVAAGAVQPDPTGELRVQITLSASPDYLERWARTSPETPAPFPRLKSLRLGQVGYAAFVVSGVTPAEDGNFNATVSWKLIGPAGQVIFMYPEYARASGKTHHRPAFYMADPALDIVLEKSDPPGEYTLQATVVDAESGTKAVAARRFQFIK